MDMERIVFIKSIRKLFFLLFLFSMPLAWSQESKCQTFFGALSYLFQAKVKTLNRLNQLARPLHDVWSRAGFDGRGTTALVAKVRSLPTLGGTDVYRGMWVTPEELIDICKNGIRSSGGNYGSKIHFSADPAEAIRYGAQGANDKKGILILISANSKKGKIYPRDASEVGSQDMVSVADDFVPPEAISSMWAFDPDESRSEYAPFRSIKLKAIRKLP